MSLILETGTGVQGATSYADAEFIKAYWTARPHDPRAAVVGAAEDPQIEGAASEASAFLDATYGSRYRGRRRGYLQGLLWPRTGAKDSTGYDLPDLPDCLPKAVAELAARALEARLASDDARGGAVASIKEGIGSLREETVFRDDAQRHTDYGFVPGMLEPILTVQNWNFG